MYTAIIPAVIIVIRIMLAATNGRTTRYRPAPVKWRYKMKWKLWTKKIVNANNLFNGHFIDVKSFYVMQFNKVPCVSFIGDMDVTKCYALIKEKHGNIITHTYQHNYFDHDAKTIFFNNTVFVLANNRLIELGNNYCHLLYADNDYNWARELLIELSVLRVATGPVHTQVVGFARQVDLN